MRLAKAVRYRSSFGICRMFWYSAQKAPSLRFLGSGHVHSLHAAGPNACLHSIRGGRGVRSSGSRSSYSSTLLSYNCVSYSEHQHQSSHALPAPHMIPLHYALQGQGLVWPHGFKHVIMYSDCSALLKLR